MTATETKPVVEAPREVEVLPAGTVRRVRVNKMADLSMKNSTVFKVFANEADGWWCTHYATAIEFGSIPKIVHDHLDTDCGANGSVFLETDGALTVTEQ